jgi:hypothetical protein
MLVALKTLRPVSVELADAVEVSTSLSVHQPQNDSEDVVWIHKTDDCGSAWFPSKQVHVNKKLSGHLLGRNVTNVPIIHIFSFLFFLFVFFFFFLFFFFFFFFCSWQHCLLLNII